MRKIATNLSTISNADVGGPNR